MRWIFCLGAFAIIGCRATAPIPPVTQRPPPVQPPLPPPKHPLETAVEGVWQNHEAKGRSARLVFHPGGQLVFEGALEFYNPGRWALNVERHELVITLPSADVDRLRTFQLAVGDGVKAFNPTQKQITYHFDEQTWSLNIAGWMYQKDDTTLIKAAPQPPLD